MTGFRRAFLQKSFGFANIFPVKWLLKATGVKVIFPFYHLVSDKPVPHVRHLYTVKTQKEFRRDLDFLLKYFHPLNPEELQEIIFGNKEIWKKYFFLTFDDGLREFGEIAAPILKEKGIPAMCFLNSAFVDNQDLFFRYKASIIADHIENNQFPTPAKLWLAGRFPDKDPIKKILEIKYPEKQLLDELAELMNINFRAYLEKKQPYLNSEEIIKLQQQGFYFGGHSIDHPEFHYLDQEEQLRQTKDSITFTKQNFNEKYNFFSFPFTDHNVSRSFFKKIYAENIAKLTFGTAGIKKDQFNQNIQRIPMEEDGFSSQQIIKTELLYSIFRSITGKNTVRH